MRSALFLISCWAEDLLSSTTDPTNSDLVAVADQNSTSTSDVQKLDQKSAAMLGRKVYSYEGNDYPGADEGILIALPQRPVGSIEPFIIPKEPSERSEAKDLPQDLNQIARRNEWDLPAGSAPYYEWMIAQARSNRFAFPDPLVQLLEQLDAMLQDFGNPGGDMIQVPVDRQLQAADVAAAAPALPPLDLSALSNSLNAEGVNGIFSAISDSVSNVASAAGQAVGVATTPPPPINQAVLGVLSILQGFQKLALAAGSVSMGDLNGLPNASF